MKRNNKKNILFIISFLIIFSALAWGTSKDEEDDDPVGIKSFMIKKRVNAAYIIIGAGHLQPRNLNGFLETNNMPPVAQNFISFGVGGHVMISKVIIGLELGRYLGKYGRSTFEYNTSLSTRYTLLNVGYLFQKDKSLMLYPFVGVGIGLLKLRVVQNNITSFGDITKGQDGSDAQRVTMLCNLGFAMDYFHRYNKKKKGRNSPVVGLRAGYMFSPFAADWKVNLISVPMGPDTRIQGPYFRVIIGLGGWIETFIKQAM